MKDLKNRITEDMKQALREGKSREVEILRFLLAGIQKKELELPPGKMTENDVLSVLQKEAKRKEESKAMFARAKRGDLVAEITGEMQILSKYLPEKMSEEEINKVVLGLHRQNPSWGFGELMRAGMQELSGRADGAVLTKIVREILSPQS